MKAPSRRSRLASRGMSIAAPHTRPVSTTVSRADVVGLAIAAVAPVVARARVVLAPANQMSPAGS